MSARRRFILSPGARIDLQDALVVSERLWGKTQRRIYRQALYDGFAHLKRYPLMGRARPEYGEGVRSVRVQQHVVIYRVTDTELEITRILHIHHDVDVEFEM